MACVRRMGGGIGVWGIAFVFLLGAVGFCRGFPLPMYNFSGTHYEVGYQMGRTFASQIKARFLLSDFTQMLPMLNTTKGRSTCEQFLNTTTRLLPQYVQEIQGMADGSGQPFEFLWMWNLRPELWGVWMPAPGAGNSVREECSDVFLTLPNSSILWGHNEDSGPQDYGYMYLVNVTITESTPPVRFIAIQYAATVPSCAFGITPNYIMSTNAVTPAQQDNNMLPRYIVNRHGLSAQSVAEAIAFMSVPVASGFAANFASTQTSTGPIVTVEGSPLEFAVRTHPASSCEFHFNMYMYLNISQVNDPSSWHREARAHQLPTPTDWQGIATILGDTEDPQYPIYRNGAAPDDIVTLFTAHFDYAAQTIFIYDTNPKTGTPITQVPFNAFNA